MNMHRKDKAKGKKQHIRESSFSKKFNEDSMVSGYVPPISGDHGSYYTTFLKERRLYTPSSALLRDCVEDLAYCVKDLAGSRKIEIF